MISAVPQAQVLTLGESMGLIKQEVPGPLRTQRTLGFGFGGAESNVAIALSRLGVRSAWLGRLGADSVGDLIERELLAEGVQVHAVRDASSPTGLMLKERPTSTVSRVCYYRKYSAGSRLVPGDIPSGLVEEAALLHVTGITPAISPTADATVEAAMRRARAAGVPVSLDINYRSGLWTRSEAATRLLQLVPLADIVFAGDDEAQMLVGERPVEDLASALQALGPEEVVIKLGERGCFASIGDLQLEQGAMSVDVVDTVGAGDAFVAGYLADRLAGTSPQQCLITAVTAGAFACLTSGDWEGLPRRRDFSLLIQADPVAR